MNGYRGHVKANCLTRSKWREFFYRARFEGKLGRFEECSGLLSSTFFFEDAAPQIAGEIMGRIGYHPLVINQMMATQPYTTGL